MAVAERGGGVGMTGQSFEEILAFWKKAYLDEVPSEMTHETVAHALKRILEKYQAADTELTGKAVVEGLSLDEVLDGSEIKDYCKRNSKNAGRAAAEVITLAKSRGMEVTLSDFIAIKEARRREEAQELEAYRQRKAAKRRWWWPWSRG